MTLIYFIRIEMDFMYIEIYNRQYKIIIILSRCVIFLNAIEKRKSVSP